MRKNQQLNPSYRREAIPYQPETMPPKSLDAQELMRPLSDASAALSDYNAILASQPKQTTSVLLLEEATLSSRIEGIEVPFGEVLKDHAGLNNDAGQDDIQEIRNYREAMEQGQYALEQGQTLTLAFVRALHKMLMDNGPGKNKAPGRFRQTQVWIGAPGSTIKTAYFVPTDPRELPVYMDEWLSYLKNEQEEPLVQTALMHAQFELLHPFLDGNGRLGRLLIPLLLYQRGRTTTPAFYTSACLESRRADYYRGLQNISKHGGWTGWVRFFLEVVTEQAKMSGEKLRKIAALRRQIESEMKTAARSQYAANIADAIFAHPYCQTANFVRAGIPAPSVHPLVKRLEKLGTLTPAGNDSNKIYAFRDLLNILNA